jgi:hypothetical protein
VGAFNENKIFFGALPSPQSDDKDGAMGWRVMTASSGFVRLVLIGYGWWLDFLKGNKLWIVDNS